MVTKPKIEAHVWDDQDWACQHYPELVAKYATQRLEREEKAVGDAREGA